MLSIDPDAIRADARRLAEETGTVGMLWDGRRRTTLEPINGIGKTFEQRLYDGGIRTYKALAAATPGAVGGYRHEEAIAAGTTRAGIDQARALVAANRWRVTNFVATTQRRVK